jgi:hypothetical protein
MDVALSDPFLHRRPRRRAMVLEKGQFRRRFAHDLPWSPWPVPCRSPCTRSRGRAARSQSGRRRKAIHPQRRFPLSVLAVSSPHRSPAPDDAAAGCSASHRSREAATSTADARTARTSGSTSGCDWTASAQRGSAARSPLGPNPWQTSSTDTAFRTAWRAEGAPMIVEDRRVVRNAPIRGDS